MGKYTGKRVKEEQRRSHLGWSVVGIAFSAALLVLSIVFCFHIYQLGILPHFHLIVFFGGIGIIDLLLVVLQYLKKTRIASKVVTVLVCIGFASGIYFVQTAKSVLNQVSDITVAVNSVNIYVDKSDAAQSISDVQDYTFGILGTIDRTNTDQCIAAIETEIEDTITFLEYESVAEAANGLLKHEIDAIIINDAYFAFLEDDELLSDFVDQIRLLWSFEIQRELTDSAAAASKRITDNRVEDEDTTVSSNSFVVYLSGNDSSGKLRSVGRSDVNILMAVNPSRNEILLVSTPRDYFVELSVADGAKDKLTHAGIYGVDVSMEALASLYHVPIRYYIRLNFSGFMNIIDALGGITVESDVAFSVADWNYVVGENDLNGIEALAFARERYSFASGDRQRGKNQEAVIKAVIKKAASPAILLNYAELMNAVTGTVETNFTQDEIAKLVQMQLSEGKAWSVTSISVDGTDSRGPCYSIPNSRVYCMIPDMESVDNAAAQLQEILE